MRTDLTFFISFCIFSVFCIRDVIGDCRLVALGDVHGDSLNMRRALQAARVIDQHGEWVAGCTTLVQTGDIVDRGADALGALAFLKALAGKAHRDGGRVIQLLGNHEIMTFAGQLQYANPDELRRVGGRSVYGAKFARGGPWREYLQRRPIAAIENGTVFAHAGILPSFAALGVDRLNALARSQIEKDDFSRGVFADNGPTWTRKIIQDAMAGDCAEIDISLGLLGARRMVIGHTVQANHRAATYCDGRVVAIDVGLSRAIFGQNPGCVELVDDVRVRAFYAKTSDGD